MFYLLRQRRIPESSEKIDAEKYDFSSSKLTKFWTFGHKNPDPESDRFQEPVGSVPTVPESEG
jgi:hypothetical protein